MQRSQVVCLKGVAVTATGALLPDTNGTFKKSKNMTQTRTIFHSIHLSRTQQYSRKGVGWHFVLKRNTATHTYASRTMPLFLWQPMSSLLEMFLALKRTDYPKHHIKVLCPKCPEGMSKQSSAAKHLVAEGYLCRVLKQATSSVTFKTALVFMTLRPNPQNTWHLQRPSVITSVVAIRSYLSLVPSKTSYTWAEADIYTLGASVPLPLV